MDALILQVSKRRCAIALRQVREVLPAVAIHELPGAPRGIEGVVNVRGEVIPVVGLSEHLGGRSTEVIPSEYFVLAECNGRRMILRSETLPSLSELPDPAEDRAGTTRAALAAVRPLDDGLVLVQHLEVLLDDDRAARLGELVASTGQRA